MHKKNFFPSRQQRSKVRLVDEYEKKGRAYKFLFKFEEEKCALQVYNTYKQANYQ